MKDPRIIEFSNLLLDYSVSLQPGEKILIEASQGSEELVQELIQGCYRRNAFPFVAFNNQRVTRALIQGAQEEQLKAMAQYDLVRMKEMDAYLGIRGSQNVSELSDVPASQMMIYQRNYQRPVHSEERVRNTKWCVMIYPTSAAAQMAKMSTEAFEDFYFNVCCMDYEKMSKAMDPLVKLMEKTDQVRLVGPGTDLTFSIKGMPAVKCDGKLNIPDGEVFTAPVKESVNGVIQYNTPAAYQGFTYERIHFEFENGKIVKATSNDTERINQVLNTDEGARYIGEFSFGVNPYITKPMTDTLFDEKIAGSIHFTPGNAYDECDNGNRSAVHWDLVYVQTPEFGGGEIYFDGQLIRKDGLFVLEELKGLNPEALK